MACSQAVAGPSIRTPTPGFHSFASNAPHLCRRLSRRLSAAPAALLTDAALQDSIVIVGAGPAGLAIAVALQKVGLPIKVLERQPELPTAGAALGLWTNAWRALDALGVGQAVRERHPQISGVQLCRQDGRLLREFSLGACDGGPHEFRGVRRSTLVQALAAQLAEGTIDFGAGVDGLQLVESSDSGGGDGAVLKLRGGRKVQCKAVVGADGVRSPVAAALGRSPANPVGQIAIRGVANFLEGVPCDCIRQVWGPGRRAGMYPISKTELYWFVCFDAGPKTSSAPPTPEALKEEAARLVKGWGWALPEIVEATPAAALVRGVIADRWDLPLGGSGGGRVATLAGDALHPMTPNLGQGGCTALEDGVVLAQMLAQAAKASPSGFLTADSIGAAFAAYEKQRLARCLPLTVRAHLMGAALQLPLPPVVAARDWFVANRFDPSHFLDHAEFDCGSLPLALK